MYLKKTNRNYRILTAECDDENSTAARMQMLGRMSVEFMMVILLASLILMIASFALSLFVNLMTVNLFLLDCG